MKRALLVSLLLSPFVTACVPPDESNLTGTSGSGGSAVSLGAGGAVSGSGGGTATGGNNAATGGGSSVDGGVGSTGGRSGTGVPAADAGSASDAGAACATNAIPATVQAMLTNKCAACHGTTPLSGLPSLMTYANLTAISKSDATKTNAALCLTLIQSTAKPMPPAGGTAATAAEISALQTWINANYMVACPAGTDAGAGGASGTGAGGGAGSTDAGTGSDPFSVPPTCTSKTTWTKGNNGSASMNPGMACINCHKSSDGPTFTFAGTVYPTGHEPNLCNGSNGSAGARVVITGADGASITLTPNAVGNFNSTTAVKMPYRAKVTFMGRERIMISTQTTGDCNSCHTQTGTNNAPGRIVTP